MNIFDIQSLIARLKLVNDQDIDPENTYLQIGIHQPNNRKKGGAENSYPPYVIKLSDIVSMSKEYQYYVEVDISSSQILNSFTTPILLLPANEPNEYYDFKLYIETIGGTTDYTNGNQSEILYRNKVINTYEKGLFEKPHIISCSSLAIGFGLGYSTFLNIDASLPPSADALFFQVTGANPTGGNRSAKAKIWYNIIKVG